MIVPRPPRKRSGRGRGTRAAFVDLTPTDVAGIPACKAVAVSVRRIVPDLHATHPAAGADFYAEVLGLELVMDQGWIATYADPANPAAQLSVMSHDATAPVVPDASIEVDDVDAAHAAAVARGAEIVHPLTDEPWGVRRFFVREPGGRVLNVLTHG